MKTLLVQSIKNPLINSGEGQGLPFFQSFIPNLVGIAFVIGALVFFFVMIIGAIQWITSGGDKASLESARGKIVNAVVGFVVLVAVFALLKVLEDFFGIDILTLDIGPLQIR